MCSPLRDLFWATTRSRIISKRPQGNLADHEKDPVKQGTFQWKLTLGSCTKEDTQQKKRERMRDRVDLSKASSEHSRDRKGKEKGGKARRRGDASGRIKKIGRRGCEPRR